MNWKVEKTTYIIEFDDSTPVWSNDIKKEFDHIPNESEKNEAIKKLQLEVNKYNEKVSNKELEKDFEEKWEESEKENKKEEELEKEANQKKIEKAKEILENMRLSAIDIQPRLVNGNKWVEWISEFSRSDLAENIQIDVEDIDLENNIVKIEFNDFMTNEIFNKWLELNWILTENWEIDKEQFDKEIKKAVAEAIRKMIKIKEEEKTDNKKTNMKYDPTKAKKKKIINKKNK